MADHEIHITPHVNLTEIRDFERHLTGIQRQFDALIGSAQGYVEEILNELKALNAQMHNLSGLANQSQAT